MCWKTAVTLPIRRSAGRSAAPQPGAGKAGSLREQPNSRFANSALARELSERKQIEDQLRQLTGTLEERVK